MSDETTAIATVTSDVDAHAVRLDKLETTVKSSVDAHAARLDKLETTVKNIAAETATAIETAGSTASPLLQEVVDFLHWLFPQGSQTKPTPGAPSLPPASSDVHGAPAPAPAPATI